MKRIYYLTTAIESADRIARDLHAEGVSDWNFHVLSRDKAGLYKRHINSTNPWHELDIAHSALRGTGIGLVAGLLAGGIIYYLADMGPAAILVMAVIGALFGTWLGGFVGISHENYKIARFHADIEAGKYLVMVDVHAHEEARVRAIMQRLHPEALESGEDSSIVNPLEGHMGRPAGN